ncbi:MAG: helix-turn-helix domain-containing protein [Dysgonomonas sp.]
MVITNSNGESKLNAYEKLHSLYMDNLSDDASLAAFFAISREYEAEARDQKSIKRQGDIMLNNLIASTRMNHFEEVDKNINKTLTFLKEHKLTDAMYITYKQQILSYCRRGMYEKAITEMQRVYEQARQQNDGESQFYMQYLMGVIYMHQNRLHEAEQHYKRSIEIAEKLNKRPFGLIGVYSELCNMLQATGRLDEFFEMAKQAESLLEKLTKENKDKNYNTDKMNLWTLYAFAYDLKREFDKAEFYCNRIDSIYGRDVVSLGNTTYLRSHIWEARGDYSKALAYINKAIEIDPTYTYARFTKIRILSRIENAPLTWSETEKTVEYIDSLRNISYNKQLDELRTQYEVDRHVAEKEKVRHSMYFALAGCLLLTIILCIWIYYNRKIAKKNRALACQIKELQARQKKEEIEFLDREIFEIEDVDDDLCPEKRKDLLCIAIRDILLKEKAYRDPAITRDNLVERLGTNKELFINAFQYCFSMPFPEYLNSLRLKDAITLLEESDLTIEEISEKVGFGTVRTFQRQCQSKYNMSPKEYRKAAII